MSPKSLSSPQMPQFLETIVTIPIRSDMVRISTVPRIVRSPVEMYDIVPGVFNTIQYGTPCNQDFVPITVPFFIRIRIKNP